MFGLGMARGRARAGPDIALWSRSPGRLEDADAGLSEFGGRVVTRSVDVADEQAVVDGVAATVEVLGGLDVVVVNAGIGVPLGRWATPEDFEGIAVYLASDTSAFQTGSSTTIDGGYSIF